VETGITLFSLPPSPYIFTAILGEAGHFSRRGWRQVERVRSN
jgi:hypothetical protein